MTRVDYVVAGLHLSITVLLSLVLSLSAAHAEPMKSHGLFNLKMEMLGQYDGRDLGGDEAGAIYQYTLEIKNVTGAGFLHDANAKCFAIGYFTNEPEHQTGFCYITDVEGDKILQRYHRSTLLGYVTFLSGTGKYVGISGKAEYEVDAEDVWEGNQVASTLNMMGSYEFPKRTYEANATRP